jgi:hypothetical protein
VSARTQPIHANSRLHSHRSARERASEGGQEGGREGGYGGYGGKEEQVASTRTQFGGGH